MTACPECGGVLAEVTEHGVRLGRCGGCEGRWFPAGTLHPWLHAQGLAEIRFGWGTKVAGAAPRPCPGCGAEALALCDAGSATFSRCARCHGVFTTALQLTDLQSPWNQEELVRSRGLDWRGGLAVLLLGVVVAGIVARLPSRRAAAPPAAADSVNPAVSAALARSNAAAGRVYRFALSPDSVVLRVGQRLDRAAIRVTATDAAGAPVADFEPLMFVPADSIAVMTAEGVVGRRPGRTRLIMGPWSLDPAIPVRNVADTVIIRVVP